MVGRFFCVKSSAGSIPTTGQTNKQYLLELNTCTQSWLIELEQFNPGVQVKVSVRDSMLTPGFIMKQLKKAEGHIGRNVVIITIIMRVMVRIF